MNNRLMARVLGLACAGLLITACDSGGKKVEPPPAPPPAPVVEAPPPPPPPPPPKPVVNGPVDDSGNAVGNTVYFDFDKATINADGQKLIGYHAKYLSGNSSQKVAIEGHCDERGTREYNLALGERRAGAVKEALVAGGVQAGNLDTVSFGEEKPVDPGHDESAWSKNRRAEMNYKH